MRDRDKELIANLAAGRLEDPSDALALVEGSEEHRLEYEAQLLAFTALSKAGHAQLTDTERAGLRRDVWTELRSPPEDSKHRTPWYYRWVPAAGLAVVLVGFLGVLSLQRGGDSGGVEADQFQEISSSLASGGEPDTASATTGAEASADEAEGVAEDTVASPSADRDSLLYADATILLRSAASYSSVEQQTDVYAGCLLSADLNDHTVLAVLEPPELPEGMKAIAAIPENTDPATATITFVDIETCEVVHIDEP